ncbi:MAG: PIN domain-containing protein [Acidobacteria bacterium]|nr:PIN domain-containing protein [Acidobacteriota bacterium]MCG3193910.1 hypothetical protein [Thermoanaerobaculia bacterium]
MPGDAHRQFLDTNVLVYAFDVSAGAKRSRAKELIASLAESREASTSLQVLQEFFVTITRKVPAPLPIEEARVLVDQLSHWHLHCPDRTDLLSAIDLSTRFRLSFWDSLVLQSARRLHCETLWTEDLQDGQVLENVTVRNPFAGS